MEERRKRKKEKWLCLTERTNEPNHQGTESTKETNSK
jgi:hypothetical protein